MISSKRLVYEFDLRYNRLESTHDSALRLEDKLAIINQGLRIVYQDLVSKAEINSHYRNALKPLEVKEQEFVKVNVTENYDIYKAPEKIFKILRLRALASKEGCGTKEIPISFFQTDDLDNSMSSGFLKPSFAWELLIGDEGKEGYYIWHKSDCDILKVIGDYYIPPEDIQYPSGSDEKSYIDWNGKKQTKDVGLALDANFIFDRIIDMAILVARNIKGDVRDYELQANKILNTDKINN